MRQVIVVFGALKTMMFENNDHTINEDYVKKPRFSGMTMSMGKKAAFRGDKET